MVREQIPILTVAIPTYNRSRELKKTLEQLFRQKSKGFNILISDDGSTDNTRQMVRKLQSKHSNLFYHQNKTNEGYSGNVCRLYELARTKYIWFLCDDDTVSPDAVKVIQRALEKYSPTVAIFNYTWTDPYARTSKAYKDGDKLYSRLTDLPTYQPLMRLTFLSTLVMRKGPSLGFIKKTPYKKNIFFQITLGLHLLSKRFVLLESKSVILHRNVGYNYGEFFKSYMTDHLDAVSPVKKSYDFQKFVGWSKSQLLTTLSVYLSQKIGLFKYNGSPSSATKQKLKKYYGFYSYIIAFFPYIMILTPSSLIQFFYLINLYRFYKPKKARKIFAQNYMRAKKDTRSSGFLKNS